MSGNKTEAMDANAWAELYRLREAVKGPAGHETWQDAATAERRQRVLAERDHIATVEALQARINALEARQWFLADETDDAQDDAWIDAQEAYEKAAGCLRGHLEWRDRVRAAVRVLMACEPQPDSSKEAP